ncbi:hypothetical protein [Subtercola lobariae]|uniref:Uncharacterized protein n=1 Tax=Subtercola lobariae TaxID=1588641 RepID=A0A917B6J7_9MICO|nr:hypothetical protein [Subtercola lobariae]GGF23772.1 hypothetical protein GCM10011399_16710 [Subtercola lobariae]
MPTYGNARADWKLYPRKVDDVDAPHSPDAEFVDRIKATLRDRTQSYAETMERITRIANEWRASDATPRELERLARLIFHTMEPGDSWAEAPDHVKDLYRDRAETLLEGGYRKVDH